MNTDLTTTSNMMTREEIAEFIRDEIRIFREEHQKTFKEIEHDLDEIVESPSCKKMTRKQYDRVVYFTQSVYVLFTLIWILLCVVNNLYDSIASFVLFIPIFIFLLGFFNAAETCHCEVESDVFSVTFVSIGILFSMPLLTLVNKDGKPNRMLNHVVYLGMISILLSYFHLWVSYNDRHVCKAIRSCLETFSITLYIYAISIFFLSD